MELCLCAVNPLTRPLWDDEGSACRPLNHRWDRGVWAGRQHVMDECVSLGLCVQSFRTTGKWRGTGSLNICVFVGVGVRR